jgi:hypothetical protein
MLIDRKNGLNIPCHYLFINSIFLVNPYHIKQVDFYTKSTCFMVKEWLFYSSLFYFLKSVNSGYVGLPKQRFKCLFLSTLFILEKNRHFGAAEINQHIRFKNQQLLIKIRILWVLKIDLVMSLLDLFH